MAKTASSRRTPDDGRPRRTRPGAPERASATAPALSLDPTLEFLRLIWALARIRL